MKRAVAALLVWSVSVSCQSGAGQRNFSSVVSDDTARIFLPGVISAGLNFGGTLSPDGTHFLLNERVDRADGTLKLTILESRFSGGAWSKATPVPFSGPWRDIDPAFAPDGKRLYFNSDRPHPDRAPTATDYDIWYVERTGAAWGEPVRITSVVNSSLDEYFATPTSTGVLYYTARGGANLLQVNVRAQFGTDGRVTQLDTLQGVGGEKEYFNNLFVAPDESWLLVNVRRPPEQGDAELYVVEREGNGWRKARPLGPEVNTAASEFAQSVSPDGKHLFFTRMIRGTKPGAAPEREDVMVISARVLGLRLP